MNKSQTDLYPLMIIHYQKRGARIDVYSSITLACQTKEKNPVCEDCFARKTCRLHVETKNQQVKNKWR